MPEKWVVFKAQKTPGNKMRTGLPYLICTGHSVWEIRSQHCVLSREKETKKIKKEEQSHLTWLRSLFPMDGNQKSFWRGSLTI